MNIETDPPGPPYRAATYIAAKCNVESSLPILYNWTVLCTSQGSNQVSFGFQNFNNTEEFTLWVRSTPTRCHDTIMCTAVDSAGDSAEASVPIGNITGEPSSDTINHSSILDTGMQSIWTFLFESRVVKCMIMFNNISLSLAACLRFCEMLLLI